MAGKIDRQKLFNSLVSEYIKTNPDINGKTAQKNVSLLWSNLKNIKDDNEQENKVKDEVRKLKIEASRRKCAAVGFFNNAIRKSKFIIKMYRSMGVWQ